MALYVTQGQRHTGRSNAADVKTRDISAEIAMYQPEVAPFYSLFSKFGSAPAKQMKVEYAMDDTLPAQVTIDGTVAIGGTSLKLDSGQAKYVRVHSVWQYSGGEKFKVLASNPSTDYLTISRAYGGSTEAELTDNGTCYQCTEAFEEGVQYSDAISRELVLDYNYLQDMEVPISMSDIQDVTEEYTTADWDHQTEKAALQYKELRERTLWNGYKDLYTGVNGRRVWTTGGVDDYIVTGFDGYTGTTVTVSGILTKRHFEQLLVPTLQYGKPSSKVLFAAPAGMNQINNCFEGAVEVTRSENTMGMVINKININGHIVPVIENQQFVKMGWNDRIYLVDMSLMKKRYLSTKKGNFNTRTIRGIQEPDRKGKKDVIRGIEGLERKNPRAHGRIKGFSTT